ncbi:LysR family transcriptional regulator ['Osedax' symbiont bacterium Rs2_46_30_T18]|nr:LysR family transcriptional regulator ['Osedax' symbiont bacterium Rs2_46_30_T18]
MKDDIFLFVNIVQQQSLAKAAAKLSMPAATVSRRLKHLEEQVGYKLIHRSARAFTLSTQGDIFYNAYVDIVEQFEARQQQLEQQMGSLDGPLKVLAPNNISTSLLRPMWSSFIGKYPEIKLDLTLSNETQNLTESRADIALRIGPQTSSALYQKRVGSIKTLLVTSDHYLANNPSPEQLSDLTNHRLIGTHHIAHWQMYNHKTAKQQALRPKFSCLINDVKLITQLVIDGLGIALLPYSEIQHHLEVGKLIRVLPQWQGPVRDIYTLWPSGKLLSNRALCLRDFIEQFLQNELIIQQDAC